jgi:hypothetical protein
MGTHRLEVSANKQGEIRQYAQKSAQKKRAKKREKSPKKRARKQCALLKIQEDVYRVASSVGAEQMAKFHVVHGQVSENFTAGLGQ